MADQFAKLYERDGRQILVFTDRDDDGDPAIKVVFQTPHGNRCSLAFGFEKSNTRNEAFERIDETYAFGIVDDATKAMPL